MLTKLELKNFTAFSAAEFQFCKGLNIIVGENGTGKTHILKAAYAAISMSAKSDSDKRAANPTKSFMQAAMADRLLETFKPDSLGRLSRHDREGRQRAELAVSFSDHKHDFAIAFNTASKAEVIVEKTPSAWLKVLPVYLPTRELLTIYPNFISTYETSHIPFEGVWRDTCVLLGAGLARGLREKEIKPLLEPLEEIMGGKVVLEKSGGFYLSLHGVDIEMHLVAEGLRKIAMIARLIATGALTNKGFLFWDEPEANLNPKLVKKIAQTILHLCSAGIQVILATHSLFLLREFELLLMREEYKDTDSHYIGLHSNSDGVSVEQGSTFYDIGNIASLDEDLMQSDRLMDSLGAADGNH